MQLFVNLLLFIRFIEEEGKWNDSANHAGGADVDQLPENVEAQRIAGTTVRDVVRQNQDNAERQPKRKELQRPRGYIQ